MVSTPAPRLARDSRQSLRIDVSQYELGFRIEQKPRRRLAETARGSGDQDHLILQSKVHCITTLLRR